MEDQAMKYSRINVHGIRIFYRECGSEDLPVMVLFHGFPSAGHMFRDLMPALQDRFHLIAPDYAEKQSDLIFDYQNNVKMYPAFQEYLRTYQPKLPAVWGKDDPSFIWAGAESFARYLPNARIVPVSSGHFALENCCEKIAEEIRRFF